MGFLDKLFGNKTEEKNKKEIKKNRELNKASKEKKITPKKDSNSLTKEEYRKEKAKRKQIAIQKRKEAEKQIEAEKKQKLQEKELLQKEKEEKAKLAAAKRLAEKKASTVKHNNSSNNTSQKEEDDFNLFGYELKDIKLKDIVNIEIIEEEAENYIGTVAGNYEEVLLPKTETIEDIKIGETYKVVVYYRKNGKFSVSQKKVETMKTIQNLNDIYENNEVIKGKIKSYKKPFYIVEVNNDFFGRLYERNYSLENIQNPESIIGEEAEFIIKENNLPGKYAFEFSRIPILKAKIKDAIKDVEVGTKINVDQNFTKNKGGIEFKYSLFRIFIPFKEISYSFVNASSDLAQFINEKTMCEIIECKERKNGYNIVASIRKLEPKPFDEFLKNYQQDGVIEGKVVRVMKYGLFIEIADNVQGLLHQNDFSNSLSASIKEVKIGDTIQVKVKEFNKDDEKISLKSI